MQLLDRAGDRRRPYLLETNATDRGLETVNLDSVLEIDSNDTGFFAALDIQEGRVDPEAVSRGISRRRSNEIADATSAVFDRLNRIFRDSTILDRGDNASRFRAPLEAAPSAAFGDSSTEFLGFGYDSSGSARQRGDFTTIDRRELTANLQRRGHLVRDFFAGSNDEGGLVQRLLAASQQALNAVNQALGLSGTFVDTYV